MRLSLDSRALTQKRLQRISHSKNAARQTAETSPRLGSRRRYLAFEPARNRRSVNGPSVCVARGVHGPVAAHTPSQLRFWRIYGFNCWSAVADWPEKTGNSPLARSSRCRLIVVMTAALQ